MSEKRTKSIMMLSLVVIGVRPTFADQTLADWPEMKYAPIEARCCAVPPDIERTNFFHASLSANLPFIQSQLSLFTGFGTRLQTISTDPTLGFIDNYGTWRHNSPLFFEVGANSASTSRPEYHSLSVKFIGEINFGSRMNPEKQTDTEYVSFLPGIGVDYAHVSGYRIQPAISASLQLPYGGHLTRSEFNIDVEFRF